MAVYETVALAVALAANAPELVGAIAHPVWAGEHENCNPKVVGRVPEFWTERLWLADPPRAIVVAMVAGVQVATALRTSKSHRPKPAGPVGPGAIGVAVIWT